MNYEKMTAPCGLACFDCLIHLAKENDEYREIISKQFGIPKEEVGCDGCREVEGNCPVLTVECSVYPCAAKKEVKFCYECSDFPCDSLHPYADKAESLPHNTKVFNLCLIKKMGIEFWVKEKAKEVKRKYFQDKWKM